MDSARAIKGERDLPEAEKRRPTDLGTVTAVFLLWMPLLLLFFLFGDRAVASIAGDSLVWQRAEVQSTCCFLLPTSASVAR
jgi:xyloglucan fucosyltransferase